MKQCIKEANRQYIGGIIRWVASICTPSREDIRLIVHELGPVLIVVVGFFSGFGVAAYIGIVNGIVSSSFMAFILVVSGGVIGVTIGGYFATICHICSKKQY